MKNLYIDLGNTYLKIYKKENGKIIILERYLVKRDDTSGLLFSIVLKHINSLCNYNIYLINVNFKHQNLTSLLKEKFSVIQPKQEEILDIINTNDKVGNDILASIKSINELNFKPTIIVSLGTFVTITFVKEYKNNRFKIEKILIIPGLFKTIKLSNKLLKKSVNNVEIIQNIYKNGYQLNNEKSVIFGILDLFKYGIIGIIEKFKNNYKIIATGGDCWLLEQIDWIEIDKYILVKGLEKMK
ncbi:type III pantothenate kinase [Mycoplasma elephantis]|uniref:type III pantothenate kinase n=1 Tax=Mycoplasma elephantis TaxID=114882 RepID=UPI00146FA2B9|nr:type III pantothenate kinase [Mycoplasma elephantis]